MIDELDGVILTADIPEHGLAAGDIGTVVMVHEAGRGFEVEFVALDVAVASLSAARIRLVAHREIAHARPVAA
ncbi:MAG: DUF4926 domain-containing protein [Candidatus Competibacteraceae bacterium]